MFSFLNRIPPVTKNLLLINVALYILTMVFKNMNGIDLTSLLSTHYVGTPLFEPFQIVTHMFMHSDRIITHILFNMILLVIFGSHLERVWGAKHYFIFYFACGLGAFFLDNVIQGFEIYELRQAISATDVNILSLDNFIENVYSFSEKEEMDARMRIFGEYAIPADSMRYIRLSLTSGVGASGAVFGLLAAFALLFPNTELMLIFFPMPIKAKYLIGVYVLYELYKALVPTEGDFTNHWAHIGGAAIGAIIVLIRRKTNKTNFY